LAEQGKSMVVPWCAALGAVALAYAGMKWLQFGPGMSKIFVTQLAAAALLCVTAPVVRRRWGGAGLAAWCAAVAVMIAFVAGPIVGKSMDLGRHAGPLVLFCLLVLPFAAAGVTVYRVGRPPATLARTFPIAMTVCVLMELVSFVLVLAVLTIPKVF
jgi:hypothetical protein